MNENVQLLNILLITRDRALAERVQRDLSLVAGISFMVDRVDGMADVTPSISGQAQALLLHLPLAEDSPWQLLEQASARLPRLPVIVLADDSDYTVAWEALRRGAQDYLLVPALTQRPLVQALLGAVERRPLGDADTPEARDAAHYQRILDAKRLVLKELEELNEMKSQFLEVSAHEMRTPMAVIRSGVDLLMGGTMGPLNQRQEEFLGIVARNIDRLSRFATDLLNLARLDAGRYTVSLRELELEASIQPTLDTIKDSARQKNISVACTLDQGAAKVQADPDALAQVMFNLLSNAVMHCPPGTSVKVKAAALSEDLVEISVTDDGPGIPDNELPRIFDRFYQVDRKDGPGYGGTGIGLTISRALVERMGGRLSVASEEDQGTTFSFTLRTRQQPREILFGRIAQSLGFVAPAEIQGIVDAQIKDQVDKKIGQLMEEAGLLTAQQVEMVLRLQQDSLSRPHPNHASTVGESLMGHLAVKHGFISEEQLFECVAIQSSQAATDPHTRLGQVLEEKGYMTADEIAMVLQIQKMVTPQA